MARILKRILKSTISSYIIFITINLVVVFLISLLFWLSFNTDDIFCTGDGICVSGTCPSWSFEYSIPHIPFETIFIMVAGMYSVMVIIMFIGVILISHEIERR